MIFTYKKIRLVIADDNEFFRDGLKLMFEKKYRDVVEIAGSASNGSELLSITEATAPDIVLTDARMPKLSGLEACKVISKTTNSKVIALSHNDNSLIYDMLDAGAKGYLLKNSSAEEIITAVREVNRGLTYYCNSTSKSLIKLIALSKHNSCEKSGPGNLSSREIEIIRLICKELTTKEISFKLNISDRTVEDCSKKIRAKINAKSLVGIALYAAKNNIISFEDM
jgi:DNA-binding NarL/FixJ family response regulator